MAVDELVRRRRGGARRATAPPGGGGGASHVREPGLRGRDAEMAELTGWLSRSHEGRGGVLVIEGAPGIGKSRLVREARAVAEGIPIRVLGAAGERGREGVPFGALRRALDSDGRPVIDGDAFLALSEHTEQRFWLFQALQDALERAAADGPLLIVVEDLQWCDAGTLLALRVLPPRLSSHAVLWLLTVRTGSSDAAVRAAVSGLGDIGARTLRLGRLPEEAVAGVARDLLGAEPGADLLALLGRAEGRPLLVADTVRGLSNGGAAGWLPPSRSHGFVRRLLDPLSPRARELLRMASVLGREVEPDRLADLGEHTIADVVAALQEAVEADLVRATDPLTFRHDLVREAIAGTVPAPLRGTLRRRAAELSLAQGAPVGRVALAMAETAEPGDADAAALLRRALAELAHAAPDAALPIARQAIAFAPADSVERADAVAEAVPLLARVGKGGEALELAETAAGGSLPAAVEARVRLGAAMTAMQGSYAEALRHSRAGSGLDGVPDGLHVPLIALRCLAAMLTGDVPEAERSLAPSTETAAQAGNGTALALLRTADSLVQALGLDFAAAERLAAEAVVLTTDSSALFFPAVWQASLYGMTGRVKEGLRATAKGVAAARRPGHAQGLSLWLAARARLLLAAGRLAEARAEAEGVLAMAEESGAGDAVSFDALSVIGRVGVLTGDAAARARSAECTGLLLARKPGPLHREAMWLAARLAEAAGDPHRAHLDEAVACTQPTVPPWLADPADDPSRVRLMLRGGFRDHAAVLVAEAERRAAANPGVPLFAAVAAHARGLLDDDATAVQQAVGLLQEGSCPLPLASALEDAGRMLLDVDRDAAAEHLTQAEAIHMRTGAGNEAARVRRRLAAAGRRRRARQRRTVQGWDALTPAELRVAVLVAEGASNRQAAERLFLSPATVSTHVSHIFRKLGVNSRVELTRLYLKRGEAVG
ncbi:ATP-binding protein [Spirillospora sp. CA-253888]